MNISDGAKANRSVNLAIYQKKNFEPEELRDSYNRKLAIILLGPSKKLTCVVGLDPSYPGEIGECLDCNVGQIRDHLKINHALTDIPREEV